MIGSESASGVSAIPPEPPNHQLQHAMCHHR
jgi:hypothetical protein